MAWAKVISASKLAACYTCAKTLLFSILLDTYGTARILKAISITCALAAFTKIVASSFAILIFINSSSSNQIKKYHEYQKSRDQCNHQVSIRNPIKEIWFFSLFVQSEPEVRTFFVSNRLLMFSHFLLQPKFQRPLHLCDLDLEPLALTWISFIRQGIYECFVWCLRVLGLFNLITIIICCLADLRWCTNVQRGKMLVRSPHDNPDGSKLLWFFELRVYEPQTCIRDERIFFEWKRH